MKFALILLLPAILSAQIVAKNTVITGNKKIEYVSQGKLVAVDKTENGKTAKLTCLDAEFTEIAKGRPVDTDKSIAACAKDLITSAKKNKTVIEVTNDKGQKIKYDLEKENETSVYNSLVAALKAGYKKPSVADAKKVEK